ncbi:MAG: sugar phosphate nucleotidyltransferase [Bacillaceae bacterium]
MKGIILAGGRGSRLQPLTTYYPKPLLPLLDKPVLAYNIELLRSHGITEIAILIHHYGDEIKKYFKDGSAFGVTITYYEDNPPLGTAGSIKAAESFVEGEDFIVISGDVFTDFLLTDAVFLHKQKQPICTIFLTPVANPASFGLVKIDEQGYVQHFIEKPKIHTEGPSLVNTGIYLFSAEIFKFIPNGVFMDLAVHIFPMLLEKKEKIDGYVANGFWLDVGEIDRFHQASMDILGKKINVTIASKEVTPQFWLGENVEIGESVHIYPPVYIGNNVKIGDNSVIYANSVIGADCVLDKGTIVEESSVLQSRYFLQKLNNTSPTYKVALKYPHVKKVDKNVINKN